MDDRQQVFEDEALVHMDTLYHVAYRLTRSRSEAEDLVQETMLKAYQNFHQYDRGTNCRAWLFTILHHAFLNRLKRSSREFLDRDGNVPDRAEERWEHSSVIYNPEEEFFQKFVDADVERALDSLPPAFREVVVLADLEDCSYKEIAQIVGCPTGTVMSRLYRGRQLLKQALLDRARERGYIRGEHRR